MSILLALTLSSFLLAEQGGGKLAWLIVVLAGIKFVLVAWRFMELHKAALIWDVALLGLLGLILGITILLS
jgi:hypothetical protein